MLLFIHSCRYHGHREGYGCSFRAAFPFVLRPGCPLFRSHRGSGFAKLARTLRAHLTQRQRKNSLFTPFFVYYWSPYPGVQSYIRVHLLESISKKPQLDQNPHPKESKGELESISKEIQSRTRVHFQKNPSPKEYKVALESSKGVHSGNMTVMPHHLL